jgi:DNA-binding HxlR family transcriptional regulator
VESPGTADLKLLRFALDSLGYPLMEGMLTAHLRYLEEKGYVELTRRKGYGFDIAFASLTAAGWDLLDGLTHDRGVDGEL